MEDKEVKDKKPLTIMYFSNEIKSQLKYYNILNRKLTDLNNENRWTVEDVVSKYSDNTKDIGRSEFIKLKKLSMLFASVVSDIQTTITKIDYIKIVALSGFGISEFDLSDNEKKQFEALTSGVSPLLFCIKEDDKGEESLEVKDADMFEMIEQRASSMVPTDQKQLREYYNVILVSYNEEKKREDEEKKRVERQMRQQKERQEHEEELKKYGKKADSPEAPDTEG